MRRRHLIRFALTFPLVAVLPVVVWSLVGWPVWGIIGGLATVQLAILVLTVPIEQGVARRLASLPADAHVQQAAFPIAVEGTLPLTDVPDGSIIDAAREALARIGAKKVPQSGPGAPLSAKRLASEFSWGERLTVDVLVGPTPGERVVRIRSTPCHLLNVADAGRNLANVITFLDALAMSRAPAGVA